MIVSLSLIRLDTVLRLERQQMATHTTQNETVSGCVHVAYDCERCTALDRSYAVSSQSPSLLPCVSSDARFARVSRFYIILRPIGVNRTLCVSYIDLSNFCHFFLNKDSKYCFFSCKRCSLRFIKGHLSTFRATFIFLHRASKALSKAANSFIVISWSRLLRNIHS